MDLLGSDRCLHLCRLGFVGRTVVPVYSPEQVMAWYDVMPPMRVGALFDLARTVKTLSKSR